MAVLFTATVLLGALLLFLVRWMSAGASRTAPLWTDDFSSRPRQLPAG